MKILTRTMAFIVVIAIAMVALGACNCNPFDNGSTAFLTEKMNEIPIEYDGYELVFYEPSLELIYHFEGNLEFNGSTMDMQCGYEINEKFFRDYRVNYKDKTLYINDEFMREKSATYVKISRIWRTFKSKNINFEGNSKIIAVYPFDDLLFIVTDGIEDRVKAVNCDGCIPTTLYVLDWDSENVYYAGYLQDYSQPHRFLSVIKKQIGESNDGE